MRLLPTVFPLIVVRPRARRWTGAFAAACLMLAGGCAASLESTSPDGAAEHDPDDVPITEADVDIPRNYPSAVERLTAYRQQVFAAVEAGTPHKAHRPLDEMDIVIGKLMPLTRDSGVPRSDWEEVNVARRALRAQFDLIHAAIDDDQTPDLVAAEPEVDAALARLKSVAAKLSRPSHPPLPQRHEPAPAEEASP